MKKYIKPYITYLHAERQVFPAAIISAASSIAGAATSLAATSAFASGVGMGLSAGPRDIMTPALAAINNKK